MRYAALRQRVGSDMRCCCGRVNTEKVIWYAGKNDKKHLVHARWK